MAMSQHRFITAGLVGLAFGLSVHPLGAQTGSGGVPGALEIRAVTVNDKSVSLRRNGQVSLGASPENIVFSFGPRTNAVPAPLRIRYKLEGQETNWRDGAGDMFLAVRFYNANGDQISQRNFPVTGDSAGWNGSLATSPLTHRREMLTVPEQAARVWVVISSAGPPAAVGVYVVANLVVTKISSNAAAVVLLETPLDREADGADNRSPTGWTRDGNHSSMASIVTLGPSPAQKAFAILDDDPGSHAEWHNIMEAAPRVTPGEQLLIEWNEAFSIGVSDLTSAKYQNLREGAYRFHITGADIFGNPVGATVALDVTVPPLLWRTPWFWGVVIAVTFLFSTVGWRYIVWQRVRREMVRLKHERALENERLRIAQDLHDDFGARVTEISIASALARKKPDISRTASADFDRISTMSRELVAALYETVWAVNPENDNLDALGNYLCQMINRLCEQAQLPCRLRMADLPREILVSSQTRHNIMMAVKEAVHNVIKHAQATEMILSVEFVAGVLTISVQDNGRGFQPSSDRAGNGFVNMKRRLADLGGTCDIQPNPPAGTNVVLRLQMKTKR
jgi:signal transduction histidine kinase